MRILILGGNGSIGQVYACFLEKSHYVGLLMKPEYVKPFFEPQKIYELSTLPLVKPTVHTLEKFSLFTDLKSAAKETWDQIWLCISSTALRQLNIPELQLFLGSNLLWVSFQPGIGDSEWLLEYIKPDQLITGATLFSAWPLPLKEERFTPSGVPPSARGTAFVSSGLVATSFSGTELARQSFEKSFNSMRTAGFRVLWSPDARASTYPIQCLLQPWTLALGQAGWRWSRVFASGTLAEKSDLLALVLLILPAEMCSLQVLLLSIWVKKYRPGVLASSFVWFAPFILRPWLWRTLFFFAYYILPFDQEAFFALHFGKKHLAQTQQHLLAWRAIGESVGVRWPLLPRLLPSGGT